MSKDKSLGADGQPKYFMSEDKASAFIERKGLGDTHHVVPDGSGRHLILPITKADETDHAPQGEE